MPNILQDATLLVRISGTEGIGVTLSTTDDALELGPEFQPGGAMFDWYFEMIEGQWLAWVPVWNGVPTDYNPTGRRFKRKQLQLMAQQEAFDKAGVSGFAVAETADELLERAEEVARLGERIRKHLG